MATSGEISPGQMLGSCRVLEQVGAGGMGAVYRAYQPGLDRTVAVKVISPMLTSDPVILARFRREAQTVASFRHPHILTVYDFGEQDGLAYLVTEFAEGGTLRARMTAPFGIPQAIELLRPIGDALDYAHLRGVVHRDVKPANVLVHADGTLVLSDFGLALLPLGAHLQQLTASGLLLGTPAYMAPEQARSAQVGAPADLYALGVIAYELLTGTVPFSGETPLGTMLAHIQDPLPPARSRNPGLPPSVEAVLARALAKQPEDRFATAREMVDALAAAAASAEDEPTVATPFPPGGFVPGREPVARGESGPAKGPTSRRDPITGGPLQGGPLQGGPPVRERESLPPGESLPRRRPVPGRALVLGGIVLGIALLGVVALSLRGGGGTPIAILAPSGPTPILGANWQVLPASVIKGFSTLAIDKDDFLYAVADDHRIQKLSPNGQTVGGPWGTSGGPVEFDQPTGIAIDANDTLYVTERGKIQRIQKLKLLAPDWLQAAQRLGAQQLNAPGGIAVAPDASVYVADSGNDRIQKWSATGQQTTHSTEVKQPGGIAVDAQGNLYVADAANDRIQKLSPEGRAMAQWGTHGTSVGQFNAPAGIALDKDGNIFVADSLNGRIQKLSPTGQSLAVWGEAGDGAGQFNAPTAVAVDRAGTLYVAEAGSGRLQKLVMTQTSNP